MMGGILSHISKPHDNIRRDTSPRPGCVSDPRSPSEGIQRTPIIVEKKPYLETNLDDPTPVPLRVQLLRRNYDPRSPTAGVDRTPIAISGIGDGSHDFGSPVSIYSNYQSEVGSYLPSPAEPSVNVSDFESSRFYRELDSLVDTLNVCDSDVEDSTEAPPQKLELRSSPRLYSSMEKMMTKKMCEDLIVEIIESFKECQVVQASSEPEEEIPTKNTKLTVDASSLSLPGLKSKKKRKPLANITSAGNTPTRIHGRKTEKLVKVDFNDENSPMTPKLLARKSDRLIEVDLAGENSPMMMGKRAQWDHESTIII